MSVTSDEHSPVERLEGELWAEQQKNLNLTDALIGAEAATVQAKLDNDALFDRLHAVSTELVKLKALLGYDSSTPHSQIEHDLARPWAGGGRILGYFGGRIAETVKTKGLGAARRWGPTIPRRHRADL